MTDHGGAALNSGRDRRSSNIAQVAAERQWRDPLLAWAREEDGMLNVWQTSFHASLCRPPELFTNSWMIKLPHGKTGCATWRRLCGRVWAAPTCLDAAGRRINLPVEGACLQSMRFGFEQQQACGSVHGLETRRPLRQRYPARCRHATAIPAACSDHERTSIIFPSPTGSFHDLRQPATARHAPA